MPTVLAILAEGFEEIEAITPTDLLRRAGVEVTVAALGDSLHVTGRNGITMYADTMFGQLPVDMVDCLFLPGGPGVNHLRASNLVIELVQRYHAAGRIVAAICAAPTVLHEAGILTGRRYTAHASVQAELPELIANERIVWDENILTSRGAGTALDFGLALVERLCGRESSQKIADSIHA
ncbi:MAG: DJ-1/PfpI family protein [Opitutaceae bacterium]|nr:DJ-1/PfpI family protein [Opitutaceae bacterium]